jgi:hypothetical protein
MKQLVTFIVFMVFFHQAHTQLNVSVRWGTEPISLENYYFHGKDSLIFHELKLYLSDFQFEKETRKQVLVGPQFIDLEDPNSLQLFPDFPVAEYQSLRFHFGLDSSSCVGNRRWTLKSFEWHVLGMEFGIHSIQMHRNLILHSLN